MLKNFNQSADSFKFFINFSENNSLFSPFAEGFLSTTIFSRFFFPLESLVLEEYDDSDPLPPLDDPEPEELSRFFFATFLSILEGGGEVFLRLSVGIGDAGFFSIVRGRTLRTFFG